MRRPKRRKSHLDISDITSEISQFNSTIVDGSLLDLSTKSVPLSSEADTSAINDLRQQILDLRSEMNIAHEEIANLNTQCCSLKNELVDKIVQINMLKKISTEPVSITPRTSTTPIMRKLTNIRMKVPRFSPINSFGDASIRETPIRQDSLSRTIKLSKLSSRMTAEAECKSELIQKSSDKPHEGLTHDGTEGSTVTKPKIIILGDQQAQNLTMRMTKDRENKWNDKYDMFGMIKPSATSSGILSTCSVASLTRSDEDILVLLLGSNDSNPFALFANLCNFLYGLKGQKVFIVNVQYNRYLNEQKLNNKIKLLARNYSHCKFVEMNNGYDDISNQMTHGKFIEKLSFKY